MKRPAPPLPPLGPPSCPLFLLFLGPDSGKWEQRGPGLGYYLSRLSCLFWLVLSTIFSSHIPVKPLFKTSGPKGGSCSTVRGLVVSKLTFLFPERAVLWYYYNRQLETDKAKPQTTNVLVFFRTGTPLTNLDLLTLLYLQQPDSIGFSFTDGSSKALLLLHLFAIALHCAALLSTAVVQQELQLSSSLRTVLATAGVGLTSFCL